MAGVPVRLAEVGKEAAFGVVAAMHFVEEVDALNLEIVVAGGDHSGIILELLDIDHSDLGLAGVVVDGAGGLDLPG